MKGKLKIFMEIIPNIELKNDWSKRIAQIIDDIEVKTARWMELADLF